jgi:hypothetical protein
MLHELCWNQQCSVLDVKNANWVVAFRERLQGVISGQWYELAMKLNNVRLSDERDIVVWKWTTSKKLSIRSVYEQLSRDETDPYYKRIWKAKISEKIKILMWLVEQQAILTKDNMVKRRWQEDPGCLFCGAFETPDRLLFSCPQSGMGCSGYMFPSKNKAWVLCPCNTKKRGSGVDQNLTF